MTMPPQEVEELDVDAAKVEGDVIVEDVGHVEDEVKVGVEDEVHDVVNVGVDVKVLDEVMWFSVSTKLSKNFSVSFSKE